MITLSKKLLALILSVMMLACLGIGYYSGTVITNNRMKADKEAAIQKAIGTYVPPSEGKSY